MSVTVYIWSHDRTEGWGHSSVMVCPGPYISWWPSDSEDREYTVGQGNIAARMIVGTTNIYKVKHRTNNSLAEDIRDEGRQPQYIAEFHSGVLSEDAIDRWWQGYNYANASYHSIKKNCSTTV